MHKISFVKYTDVDSQTYTTIEVEDAYQLVNGVINLLTNRKKGYPREVRNVIQHDDGSVTVKIGTNCTKGGVEADTSNPFME